MRLENWHIEEVSSGKYWVTGHVFDNPQQTQGKYIHTSLIKTLDLVNKKVQTTMNIYELGEPK